MILFKATVRKNFKTGEKLFYPMLVEPSVVSFEELLNSVQEICSLTLADVTAIVKSFQEVVLEMLSEGYSVHVDNLGSFRPTLKATSVENKDDVSADLIKQVHCVFTPSVRLRLCLLKCASVQMCEWSPSVARFIQSFSHLYIKGWF